MVIKKRKFEVDQLGLPTPKHKCCDRTFLSNTSIYMLDENVEEISVPTKLLRGPRERSTLDYGSEAESVKDNNSFVGDDRPSTSSVNCGTDSFVDTNYSYHSLTLANDSSGKDETEHGTTGQHSSVHDSGARTFENFKDGFLEFENHLDYVNSGCGDDSTEQFTDKELQDILGSNGLNHNLCMLPSGRWSVSQGNFSFCLKTLDMKMIL